VSRQRGDPVRIGRHKGQAEARADHKTGALESIGVLRRDKRRQRAKGNRHLAQMHHRRALRHLLQPARRLKTEHHPAVIEHLQRHVIDETAQRWALAPQQRSAGGAEREVVHLDEGREMHRGASLWIRESKKVGSGPLKPFGSR
jgi:hypothetical protein